MIEIKQSVKAKVTAVNVLSQKNRAADENPGAKLKVKIPLTIEQMEMLAPGSSKEWYEAVKNQPKQAQLEGVEQTRAMQLNGLGLLIKKVVLSTEFTGYKLTIVRGTGRTESNLVMTDSIISPGSYLELKETGCTWTCDIESANASENDWKKLPRLKGTNVELLLEPPVVAQEDLDLQGKRDEIPPAPDRKPGAAEKAAVAKVKGASALPKPEPHKGEAKPARTARGKAATKEALEKGAEASKGGPQPDGARPFPKDPAAGGAPPQSVTIEKVRGAQAEKATAAFVASSQAKH